jgi:hypothetical protein
MEIDVLCRNTSEEYMHKMRIFQNLNERIFFKNSMRDWLEIASLINLGFAHQLILKEAAS